MPLLPSSRRLKHGRVWYGQERFSDGRFRQFNTCAAERKTAATVCEVVRDYCRDWTRAQTLLSALKGCRGDSAIRALLVMLRDEFAAGRDPLSSTARGWPFAEVAESYIIDRRDSWAAATAVSRRSTFARFAAQFPGLRASAIGREDVLAFKDELLAHLRPNSVNIHLRNLRAFLGWYAEQEPSYRPPKVRQVKAPGSEHRDSLTRGELTAVLNAATYDVNGQPVAPFYAFLALTGMRRGEALACCWEWLHGRFIQVPASKTKTNRKRLVPITDELRRLLETLPEPHTGPLWRDQFRDPSKLSKLFRRAVQAAGIARPLKLHNLRDTYIVAALVAGVPAALVAQIVGNSVTVIERHYAALAEHELQRASELLNTIASVTNLLPGVSREM